MSDMLKVVREIESDIDCYVLSADGDQLTLVMVGDNAKFVRRRDQVRDLDKDDMPRRAFLK
jgi:hypothetical protein